MNTIAARKTRVSMVLAVLPAAAARGGLVEPAEPALWAQLPEVNPIMSAMVVARPKAIHIGSSFITTNC